MNEHVNNETSYIDWDKLEEGIVCFTDTTSTIDYGYRRTDGIEIGPRGGMAGPMAKRRDHRPHSTTYLVTVPMAAVLLVCLTFALVVTGVLATILGLARGVWWALTAPKRWWS